MTFFIALGQGRVAPGIDVSTSFGNGRVRPRITKRRLALTQDRTPKTKSWSAITN